MDFAFTEEQEGLKTAARDFLEKECPTSLVRQMEADEKGYPPELWHKMTALGWTGLPFPEKYDGSGKAFLDLAVVLEEMGRALLPSPFVPTVVCSGLPILWAGTEKQKQEFLPRIAKGELIFTLALTEANGRYDAAGIKVRATTNGDDFTINGTKLFIPYANTADYFLCATTTGTSGSKEEKITLFLIKADLPGISVAVLDTIASDKQCEVVFHNVRVAKENILGELNRGWEIVARTQEYAATAECALMLGGAQKVLEMTVSYSKERIQYGKPIGSFQVYQHHCADMLIGIQGARFATYQAAWRLSEGLPGTMYVSVAKAWTNQVYQQVCADGAYLHGGIGFTWEHDMQLYLRRAKAAEVTFGDTDFHKDMVAQQMDI